MSLEHPEDNDGTNFQLGRLFGIMDVMRSELTEVKTRLVFRLDNLEQRVEALEVSKAASSVYTEVVKKGTWAVLGAAGIAAGNALLHYIK